jgi:hypothetical protein
MVMVRFSRVRVAALPLCHPQVIRSCQLIRHDGSNTLEYQDKREGFRTLPLNTMECEFAHIIRRWARQGAAIPVIASSRRGEEQRHILYRGREGTKVRQQFSPSNGITSDGASASAASPIMCGLLTPSTAVGGCPRRRKNPADRSHRPVRSGSWGVVFDRIRCAPAIPGVSP